MAILLIFKTEYGQIEVDITHRTVHFNKDDFETTLDKDGYFKNQWGTTFSLSDYTPGINPNKKGELIYSLQVHLPRTLDKIYS